MNVGLMELAGAERRELSQLLRGLGPAQWAAPSLCEGWTVHDVVAHMVSYEELTARDVMRRFAQGRLHPDRINAVGVAEYRRRSPEQLIAVLDRYPEPHGFTAGLGGAIGLADAVMHQQDIRRPLGLARVIPPERLVPVLWTALFAPVVRGILRVWDVRLVATDLDWSFGRGPELRGPAEALLMTVAGRRGVVGELAGPGRERVARRIERGQVLSADERDRE